mgnify:CR=1 FL=1
MLFGSVPLRLGLMLIGLLLGASASLAAPQTTATFLDHKNGTVSDPARGLMWKKCSEGQSWRQAGNSCAGQAAGISWDDALNQVEMLNAGSGFAGHKDWRLPTIKELATLVEYDRPNPIDLSIFPGTPGLWYWSSTPYQKQASRAWFVAFGSGDISSERIDNPSLHVRLVRTLR